MLRAGPPNAAEFYGRREFIRFAKWTKLALAAIALLLLALVFLWPQFEEEPSNLPPSPSGDTQTAEQGAAAKGLYFRGFDKKNQPFNVTAEQALQEERGSDEVTLISPAAEIHLKEGERLAATAEKGYYNRRTDELRLVGGVTLSHGEDLELVTQEAVFNLKNGTARSDKPVDADAPEGHVVSQGLLVMDEGKKIIFTGRSRLFVKAESE